MTGTAATEVSEFDSIYKLPVAVVPTNRALSRTDNPDVVFRLEQYKWKVGGTGWWWYSGGQYRVAVQEGLVHGVVRTAPTPVVWAVRGAAQSHTWIFCVSAGTQTVG